MKRIWEVLNNRYGIYTEEQLKEEMKRTVLDIGIFTSLSEGNRVSIDI